MKFYVFEGRHTGQWYWRAVAANGRVVADGAEGYTRKRDASRAALSFIVRIRGASQTPAIEVVE